MSRVGPSWFASDELHEGSGGWYIGARGAFCIGPYESRAAAQREAAQLRRHLAAAEGVGAALDILRKLIEARQSGPLPAASYGRVSPPRAGEPPTLGRRSPRLFARYGRWYCRTREGIDVGPYPSRAAAERDRLRLVALLERCADAQQRRLIVIDFTAALPHPYPAPPGDS